MSFGKLEEILVWQQSIDLATEIYSLCKCNDKLSKDYSLCDQIKRASVSISSNIAEGYERSHSKEFIRFLYISKGSCGELRSQLYIILKLGWISNQEFENINEKCLSISKQLMSLIKNIYKRIPT